MNKTKTNSVQIDELKDRINKLKALLDKPEQGLGSWHGMVGFHLKWISDFYRKAVGEIK